MVVSHACLKNSACVRAQSDGRAFNRKEKQGKPHRKPTSSGAKDVKSPRRGNHCLGEKPALFSKPPICSHSAVVASAAKGQLSLGSLNPKRRSVERVGAARTARAGKEAGRPFRPPGSPNGQRVYKDMSRLLKTQIQVSSTRHRAQTLNPKP